jgi:hypothetical protein
MTRLQHESATDRGEQEADAGQDSELGALARGIVMFHGRQILAMHKHLADIGMGAPDDVLDPSATSSYP